MVKPPIHAQARYLSDHWELRLDLGTANRGHGVWGPEPLRFPDLHELVETAGDLAEEELQGVRGEDFWLRVAFDDSRHCPIGRRGPQVLRDVRRERSPAWTERVVEHVVTMGRAAGRRYAGLHEIRYDASTDAAAFTCIEVPGDAIAWTGDQLLRVAKVEDIAANRDLHLAADAARPTPASSD